MQSGGKTPALVAGKAAPRVVCGPIRAGVPVLLPLKHIQTSYIGDMPPLS
jgi:hypothetical protein